MIRRDTVRPYRSAFSAFMSDCASHPAFQAPTTSPTQAPTTNLLILATGGTSNRQAADGPTVAGIAGAVVGVIVVAAGVTTLILRWSNPRNSSRIAPDPNAGAPEFQVNSDGLLELRRPSLAREDMALVQASPADQPQSPTLLGSGALSPPPLDPHPPVQSPPPFERSGSSRGTDAMSPRRRVVRLKPLQEATPLEAPPGGDDAAEASESLDGPAVGRWVGPGESLPASQAPSDTSHPPPEEQAALSAEAEGEAAEAADGSAAQSEPVSERGPDPSPVEVEERPAEAVDSSAADSGVSSEARWLPVISLSSLADLPPLFSLNRQPAAEGGGQLQEKRPDHAGGGESTVRPTPDDEALLEARKADLLERKKKKKKTKAGKNMVSSLTEPEVQYDDRALPDQPEAKPSGFSFSRTPRFEASSSMSSAALGPRPDYLRPTRSVTTAQDTKSPKGGKAEARVEDSGDDVYDF
jgi:hypothetical protein